MSELPRRRRTEPSRGPRSTGRPVGGRWLALAATLVALAVVEVQSAVEVQGTPAGERPRIFGRVESCGQPVAADVALWALTPPAPRQLGSVRSDPRGGFELVPPEAGVWGITVASGGTVLRRVVPGFESAVLEPLPLPGGGCGAGAPEGWLAGAWATGDRTVVGTISGRVLSAGPRRRPLEGVWVWGDGQTALAVRTGTEGRYRLPVAGRERFRLHAGGVGALPSAVTAGLVPEDGDFGAGPLFLLHPSGTIEGFVEAADGAPLEAQIELHPVDRSQSRAKGLVEVPILRTAPDGRFAVAVAADERYRLRFEKPGFADLETVVRAPSAGATPSRVRVRLVAAGGLAGRIVGPDGRGVVEGEVYLLSTDSAIRLDSVLGGRRSALRGLPREELARGGRYAFSDVATGSYRLVVVAPGYEPRVVPGIEVGSGSEVLPEIALSVGALIEGLVLTADDEPVDGATIGVALLSPDGREVSGAPRLGTRTDRRGRFAIAGLEAGRPVEVVVDAAGFLPAVSTLRAPSDEREMIVVRPAIELTGQVLDADRRPVVGAEVRLRPADSELSPIERSRARGGLLTEAVTAPDGRFAITRLEPGTVILTSSADCCLADERRIVVLAGDGDAARRSREVEVVLPPGVALAGRVVDAAGRPVAGAIVGVRGKSDKTDAVGRFRLTGVPVGLLEVTVRHPAHGVLHQRVAPLGEDVVLAFAEPARLTGRVVDEQGAPVAGARVWFRGPSTGLPWEITDPAGTFSRRVQPGAYELEAVQPGRVTSPRRRVVVEGGEERPVVLVLGRGATVQGRVLGVGGELPAATRVRAVRPRKGSVQGSIEAGGAYAIRGLAVGEWTVRVELPDGRLGEAAIRVESSADDVYLDLDLDSRLTPSLR